MGGFKDREAIADVGAGSDAEAANLGRCGVGDVVAIQVGGGEDGVVRWADNDLLKDGVGDRSLIRILFFHAPLRAICRWSRERL